MNLEELKRLAMTPSETLRQQVERSTPKLSIAEQARPTGILEALQSFGAPQSALENFEKTLNEWAAQAAFIDKGIEQQRQLAAEHRENIRITAKSSAETLRIAKASSGDSTLALTIARKSLVWTRIGCYVAVGAFALSVIMLYGSKP